MSLRRIYLSYPYSDNPRQRRREVIAIADQLVKANPDLIPLVPHLAFDGFEERYGREYAMKCAMELLSTANVLCLGIPRGRELSRGMQEELDFARKAGIEIVYVVDLLGTNPVAPPASDSQGMTYAWDWFSYHAEQRLKAFDFFLIIVGVLLVAYFTALERGFSVLAILVSAFGAIISVGFWLLDIRNAELVDCGRAALDTLEQELGLHIRKDDKNRTHLAKSVGFFSKRLFQRFPKGFTSVSTHTFWLRIIHFITFVVFLGAGVLALMGIL